MSEEKYKRPIEKEEKVKSAGEVEQPRFRVIKHVRWKNGPETPVVIGEYATREEAQKHDPGAVDEPQDDIDGYWTSIDDVSQETKGKDQSTPEELQKAEKMMTGDEKHQSFHRERAYIEPVDLELMGSVSVQAVEKFSAEETFGANKDHLIMSDRFKEWFLTKAEENVPAQTLKAYKLSRGPLQAHTFDMRGNRAEISLVHLWELLSRQLHGNAGILLIERGSGLSNMFYTRDVDNNLRVVIAMWVAGAGKWSLNASSVKEAADWNEAGQIFLR
ncbi:MAG: hypothetical protein AAB479_01300 [Patescibacteria group bacterium]